MAARWVGLQRPDKTKFRCRKQRAAHAAKHVVHGVAAGTVLVLAAAMNFAMYPDALAAVVGGERQIVGFVPEEPSGVAVPGPTTVIEVDEEDVRLLAATAWGEARSEGEGGMRAVAHVMVNRVGDRFGENLSTVILAPKQFSVWNRGDPNRRLVANLVQNPERYSSGAEAEWEIAQRVAREVLSGQSVDPTGGALFYHTRAIRPRWARVGQGRQVIGAHIFYADVPDSRARRAPRLIEVAQAFTGGGSSQRSRERQRGPRAGRVNGVIQYAPASMAGHDIPAPSTTIETTDENAAATPTLNGAPVQTAAASPAP